MTASNLDKKPCPSLPSTPLVAVFPVVPVLFAEFVVVEIVEPAGLGDVFCGAWVSVGVGTGAALLLLSSAQELVMIDKAGIPAELHPHE